MTIAMTAKLFCQSLVATHALVQAPDMYFSSTIFSPIVQVEGTAQIAHGKLLEQHHNPDDGAIFHEEIRKQQRLPHEGYIGFLPSPGDFEIARLSAGFRQGLNAFTEGFARRGSADEKKSIEERDHNMLSYYLRSERLGYAIANSPSREAGEPFSAFVRVYDGTDYRTLGITEGRKAQFDYDLPTEIIQDELGIKTDYFNNYRRQGYQIFQIGKYVIGHDLKPAEKIQARRALLAWILRNYLDPQKTLTDKVMFIFDIDSVAHAKTYAREFGTRMVDPKLFDPPIPAPEGILEVDIKTLRAHLEKILKHQDE